MKIAFLLDSLSREAGGVLQSVRGLAKTVLSTNATVSVFGISDSQNTRDLREWQPLCVHAFSPCFHPWGFSNQLLPALLDDDLDMLCTHGLWKYCSVASHRWHQRTRRPYLVHPHGMLESWALRNAKWKKRIAALLYEDRHLRDAACLCALCETEAQSIRAYGMRNPISVIPNGIDLPDLAQKTTDDGSLTARIRQLMAGRRMLLHLGRSHPKKNLENLIRAWKAILTSQPSIGDSWLLAVAGWAQGGYEAKLKRLATELSVPFAEPGNSSKPDHRTPGINHSLPAAHDSSLWFLGPQFGSAKDACYRSCDAFVLASLSEGLPMAVLEAWAYGKPVVMTAACNLPEGVTRGAAIQIGTSDVDIARGLTQLLGMAESDRKQMGARGRALVAEKFSWPQIGEQMRAVYEWVLGGGAPPAIVRL